MAAHAELTPMLRHYLELKATVPDAFLFYRMGDFYELFFDDAREVAALLDLTLTARQKGTENEAPMCGVPHHAVDGYIARLIRMGRKVAVCDQMEDPAQAKGLVKRAITRVVSPGTISDPELLDGAEVALLGALLWQGGSGAAAFLDLSTGRFFVRRLESENACLNELELLRPGELLFDPEELPAAIGDQITRQVACRGEIDRWLEAPEPAAKRLQRQFGTATLRGFGLEDGELAVRAAAAVLSYAESTQQKELAHVREIELREPLERLAIDATTLANLEVLERQRASEKGRTLLSAIDRTATAPGARLVRDWLRRPLRQASAIEARFEAVEVLQREPELRSAVRDGLEGMVDFERLATRAVLGTLSPREAAALRDGLGRLPMLFTTLAASRSRLFADAARTDRCTALRERLERELEEAPAPNVEEGRVIRAGVDPTLDENRSLGTDAKSHILEMEERERRRTGISSLKIRYNRVFGYSIEVTRANQAAVPDDYIRRQTLANAERYVTPELKELEERILQAEELRLRLERKLYEALRAAVAEAASGLQALGRAIATIDVLASFAEVAALRGYVRPRLGEPGSGLRITEGRHPVLDLVLGDAFVPNDLELDPDSSQIVLLTGPNMGGKSTYLRQTALLVLLAQAGSFVPAASAEIGLVDRIFSRVGASDDLARGESTFMVEMIETSNILRFASAQSLVILDEVGRGTATFDGLSIAWAIVEHLHETVQPLTLFATHYHELTELADLLPRVVNRTMAVKEWEDRIVFLRRVLPGTADKSYGIHVAKLAGLPQSVLQRANQVLANLEAQELGPDGRPRIAQGELPDDARTPQLPLFHSPSEVVADLLREVEIERLSPLAALNLLASLKDRLR
ncbi:MAG: DNA mismatch repair protein MutS [Thermoanaerobaculia bacterium]